MIDSWLTESEILGNLKANIMEQNVNQEQNRVLTKASVQRH